MVNQLNWAESGIAMLGPTASGKSTFLCALKQALREQDQGWVLFARDPEAQQQLAEMAGALISNGDLPLSSKAVKTIRWILAGAVERTERKGRFGGENKVKDQVEITLRLTDSSGELGRSDQIGVHARSQFIQELADSRGILYMFDPIREFTHGDSYQQVDSLLTELMGVVAAEPGSGRKLEHHVAVCVTKLDHPRVFRTAQDLRILHRDDNPWGFPRVHESDARTLFQALTTISRTGYGDTLQKLLEQYFHPERISYYATSAVGFMVNQRTRCFDPQDTMNVYRIASGEPLVRGPVHPINVIEPVQWIVRQLAPTG